MKTNLNSNAVNQLPKETVIFCEGEAVLNVALLLKGRVMVQSSEIQMIVNPGSFIGINDLYAGRYQSTYSAYEDIMLYVFAVERKEDLDQILSSSKDYHGFMVMSLNKLIYDYDQIYTGIMQLESRLYNFINDCYKQYIDFTKSTGYKAVTEERFRLLRVTEHDLEMQRDRINYYKEFKELPVEVIKSFFSYGNLITLYQIEDQSDLVNGQLEILNSIIRNVVGLAECLYDEENISLFQLFSSLLLEVEASGGSSRGIKTALERIMKEEAFAESSLIQMVGKKLSVNRKKMEELYRRLLSSKDSGIELSNDTFLKYTETETDQAMTEMADSLEKILDYSGIEAEKAKEIYKLVTTYVNLKHKNEIDDHSRNLRKKISEYFYELYKRVFIRVYREKNTPRIIDLFLIYGYADERLLTKDQLLYLYYLKGEMASEPCKVYTIKEWLTLIYEGRKEPSKNEYDLEYQDMVASLRKQGKLSDKDVQEYLSNNEKKLDYEIQNVFRYNNRTTNGQISTFIPILNQGMISSTLEKTFLSSKRINDTIKELLSIDYSAFDRVVIYSNPEARVTKEYIVKRVFPDVILMPTYGSKGIMWQEISGRRRDSAGRFLFPVFMGADLASTMVQVWGRFRWELCRTIEGTAWNDIKNKSLTSEYTDYLQFYRRNRELSEEKKEKIKLQIQKGRNSSREIFVLDYENWINYEAKGALKLNKQVRELMATYCPFAKPIREQLRQQPLFEEAIARYNREKLKKVRELESRYRFLEREQAVVTDELIDTLNYYKES